MLRTEREGKAYLVAQPDHAAVSGYLAAHWGNREFARLGHFAGAAAPDPERLRAEAVFGIAQHDNGWWEWDAAPGLAEADGLPLNFPDVSRRDQREGLDRWRLGVGRFRDAAPYGALLISLHARWLHAARTEPDPDPAFLHPLHGRGLPPRPDGERLDEARAFVREMDEAGDELAARIGGDPSRAGWLAPEQLRPHARLLQLLDGLSLSLCAAVVPPLEGEPLGLGDDALDLPHVPRRGWADRVTISLRPQGGGRVVCRPYPFDADPLPVAVPARIVEPGAARAGGFQSWWHAHLVETLHFEYRSA